MTPEQRAALDSHDLKALRRWFEAGIEGEPLPESLPVKKQEDLWSEAVEAVLTMRPEELQSIKSRIQLSALPQRAKNWWFRVLSAALDAPPEEMERLLQEAVSMPDRPQENCFDAASFLLVEKKMREELSRRYEKKRENKERLEELRSQAREAEKNLQDARGDLHRHQTLRR